MKILGYPFEVHYQGLKSFRIVFSTLASLAYGHITKMSGDSGW